MKASSTEALVGRRDYEAYAGPATFSYDANGNLTGDGTSIFGYGVENRLVSRSGGLALAYDPLGRLHYDPQGGVAFAYEGERILAELSAADSTQVLRRYVLGAGTDAPLVWYEGAGTSDRRFLHQDERGSIVAVTDATGAVLNVNSYDEYGIPRSTNAGRFQYTGQAWLPELGMYYYKARIYSPSLGRFLQPDPIGYGDGPNIYAYVHADPVNWRDPFGLDEAPFGPDPTPSKGSWLLARNAAAFGLETSVWLTSAGR